jgi:hypothetical protein
MISTDAGNSIRTRDIQGWNPEIVSSCESAENITSFSDEQFMNPE